MRLSTPLAVTLLAAPLASATNIVISNDDGWAEINIRTLYNTLTSAGNSVVLSAPAENESGTGSSDATPSTVGSDGCEFNSCPAGSPPYGKNSTNGRLNYVNSYPVTSMRYGIQNVSQTYFGGPPELAVAGFNVGANTGSTTKISGTVGAATEAVKEGIPAIAFSGSTGSQISYTTTPVPTYVGVYAALSKNVTQTLIASGKPFLPSNIWLNVNYPEVSSSSCNQASQYKFVLSRIGTSSSSKRDEEMILEDREAFVTCGGTLPLEADVVKHSGCYASISVGLATTKTDASASVQSAVQKKLNSILSCLPSS